MIVTSNKPFSAWGEIFGDDMAATAMIDRLIHNAEILSLKGDSYRLRGKDLRRPHRRQERRNRLTDHPRRPRRGPQNGSERLADRHEGPKTAPRGLKRRTSGYELRSAVSRPVENAPTCAGLKRTHLAVG